MQNIVDQLKRLSTAPINSDELDVWLTGEDAIRFLESNASSQDLVVSASLGHLYIHSVLIKRSLVDPLPVEAFLSWNLGADDTWGTSIRFSDPPLVETSPPLSNSGPIFEQAEQIVFSRSFEHGSGDRIYFEILQKLLHILELHFVKARNAWCRLDRHGDPENIISWFKIPSSAGEYGGHVITIRKNVIDKYLAIDDLVIVRAFDFTRYASTGFTAWLNPEDIQEVKKASMAYRYHWDLSKASYTRGAQIVDLSESREAIVNRIASWEDSNKEYAKFIVQDWRHDRICEVSCEPGATANYFMESDLPFELSPAFFRPEVIAKYKTDTEKYEVSDRLIYCRGAWSLRGIDFNEAGQIHAYICDLQHLPYEEQMHWKAYNEAPKGPIAKRAYKADFEGCWNQDYDPLLSLKSVFRDLIQEPVEWWTLRNEALLSTVNYPFTASADEWANELLGLDQLLNESFEEKWLRNKAGTLGVQVESQWRSLKLLEACLIGFGETPEFAVRIVAPLKTVRNLRTKLKGHASGEEAKQIKEQTMETHGSYRQHFTSLCKACDDTMRMLIKVIQ